MPNAYVIGQVREVPQNGKYSTHPLKHFIALHLRLLLRLQRRRHWEMS